MVSVGQAGTNVGSWIAVIVAVVLAHLVMWLTMRFSLMLSRLLGPGGIMLLTKISGLLLAAIATQLIMEGYFPVHRDRQVVLTSSFSRAAEANKAP